MLVFTPVIVASGIFYSNIMLFRNTIVLVGGVRILDAIHLTLAYVFAIYLIIHVCVSTIGRNPFSHVKEMFRPGPAG